MKGFWEKYTSKSKKKEKTTALDDISISNDNLAPLARRLDFFLPKFKESVTNVNRIIYIFIWAMFSTSLFIPEAVNNFQDFLLSLSKQFVITCCIVWPSFASLDTLRAELKKMSLWQACLRVIWVNLFFSSITMLFITIIWTVFLTEQALSIHYVAYEILKSNSIVALITVFSLIYFLYRYQELLLLTESFELKLAAQNELFNARMSPHFFFNTMNGLTSLVESDSEKAVIMLGNISTLFRASFDETIDISLEEEIDLCKVFLAIDEMRFHGKLKITWNLPDEDLMYDMVITALSLQSVLEKMLHHVVEMTTETIHVNVAISWENHQVKIIIKVVLPTKTLLVRHDLNHQMNFDIQTQRLKYYFGAESAITTKILEHQIEVTMAYLLHDPSLSFNTTGVDSLKYYGDS